MCADFAQIKAQSSPHTWCEAMIASARIPLSPRARIRSHMVKIGTHLTLWFQTLSHRNLTSRATMNAEFAQTKAYCSSHTFREAIAVSDHHYMGPQARSRRHIVRIGTPLTPWIQPLGHRKPDSRAGMSANFVQTKSHCSPHTWCEAMEASDRHSLSPRARSTDL